MTDHNDIDHIELEIEAQRNFAETSSYAALMQSKYLMLHNLYAPVNGDQWPEDLARRPGMIHITHNIMQPAVDTESRIEALLPRLSLEAGTDDPAVRKLAEQSEKLQKKWLDLSGWDVWLGDATKVKSMYGKTVLKPYWNKLDKRPDITVIETPGNLRIGWGSSDYKEMDWALYEYSLSPQQALRRWPDISIQEEGRMAGGKIRLNVIRHSDHADPVQSLSQTDNMNLRGRTGLQPSTYESKHVMVWDYWTKQIDASGQEHIVNAQFVEGTLAQAPTNHDYYPDLPFIVIEHDHDPSSPEGIGDIETIIDIQLELNRALSHWAQLINDEIDPAWQVDADSVPGGIIPKGGEILAVGEGKHVTPFEKQVQTFPVKELVDGLKREFHFRTGLSDILFSQPPGAQTAGRALQLQIESSANRIDPRRNRLYFGLRRMLWFWSEMAKNVNPEIIVGYELPEKGSTEPGAPVKRRVKALLGDFNQWKFVKPEITPRDSNELTTVIVNQLNNKLISLEDAMDALGVDSPLEMISKIEKERANPRLFPGDVQSYVAVLNMLQQYAAQSQAMGGAPGEGGPAGPQGEQDPAQATGQQGDNGSDVPQPSTPHGGPPEPGAGGEPLSNQTLIRAQPGGGTQALQQIKVTT